MARGAGAVAQLVKAPPDVRAAVEMFEPLEPGLAVLTRRVKEAFDPRGIFNPGRMYAGV
jgi:glycolate oxidase FAD binding subunit